jgi:mRNA interferase RelE/StbE
VAAGRLTEKISAYAELPASFANQVKKLQGEDALRLRVDDYRVLLTEDGVILRVLRMGIAAKFIDEGGSYGRLADY